MQGDADDKKQGYREKHAEIRVDAEQPEYPVGRVHGEHHEFAMGKIDHPHDAEDNGQSNSHQGIDDTRKQSAYDQLQNDLQQAALSLDRTCGQPFYDIFLDKQDHDQRRQRDGHGRSRQPTLDRINEKRK